MSKSLINDLLSKVEQERVEGTTHAYSKFGLYNGNDRKDRLQVNDMPEILAILNGYGWRPVGNYILDETDSWLTVILEQPL